MNSIRINFKKGSAVKYISHLDLNRLMIRAFNRAKLPVYYTEGFNPHPYIVFAQPLSVGFTGENELMDIHITEKMDFTTVKDALNRAMPEGIFINDVYFSERLFKNIAFSLYEINAELTNDNNLYERVNDFFSSDNITVIKQSKKSQREVELSEYTKSAQIALNDNILSITVFLPCSGSDNINPSLLIKALKETTGIESTYTLYCRKGFYNTDKKQFI